MTEQKKMGLNLDALQEARSLETLHEAAEALNGMTGLSSAVQKLHALQEESSITAKAQRFLRENSIVAVEFERMEKIKKLLDPYEDRRKLLQQNAGIQAVIESAKRQANMKAVIGIDLQAAQAFIKHLDHYRNITKQYETSFRLPQALEVSRLLADMQLGAGTIAAYARKHLGDIASQRNIIASISHPWMRETGAAHSVRALMELRGLGSALRSTQGFDQTLTAALRADLGDWRDRISFPQIVFDDPVVRTDFYVERGFDSSLTDFPEEAFQETLVLVGLDGDSQGEIEWPEAMHATDAFEEIALRRNNRCHDYLQRLERRLRQFINSAMTAQYGSDWPKKRVNPEILESWESKKSRAENNGGIFTMLIEAADFTDYEKIICRRDNWKEVFQDRFKRPENVRESLQRLQPIRVATMHSRFVNKEDELYVVAESMRLLKSIEN